MASPVEIEDIAAIGAEISHTTVRKEGRMMAAADQSPKEIMQLFTLHWICYIGISPCEIGRSADLRQLSAAADMSLLPPPSARGWNLGRTNSQSHVTSGTW